VAFKERFNATVAPGFPEPEERLSVTPCTKPQQAARERTNRRDNRDRIAGSGGI